MHSTIKNIRKRRIYKISIIQVLCLLAVFAIATSQVSGAAESERLSLGHTSLVSTQSDLNSSTVGAVTAKYGFLNKEEFKPYIGVGVAYSIDKEFRGSNPTTRIKTGAAYQVGFSYILNETSSLNLNYDLYTVSPESPHRQNDATPNQLGLGLKIRF